LLSLCYAASTCVIGWLLPLFRRQCLVSGAPPLNANGYKSDFMLASPIRKVKFSFKVDKVRAVISGEGDMLSHANNYSSPRQDVLVDKLVEEPIRIRQQLDTFAFGTVSDEMNPIIKDFFVDGSEHDLGCPTQGFSSIPEAIEDIRQGKLVIVVDDENRENEGDLIMAASMVTPKAIAFIVKHGTGIVCVSMKEEDLERLQLPLMVTHNEEKLCTAFTVTVDAKQGTTTGVSAQDRATTILKLASRNSRPDDFNRPGHIFPLKYREGGVLRRPGHTEASVDLAVLAGLEPAAALCEIVDDDGSMARLPHLRQMAKQEKLKIISIADLIRYRRKREKLLECGSAALIPTMWGPFKAYCYRSCLDGIEHIAMVKGEIGDGHDVLVRVHSECLIGDIFGATTCQCRNQLTLALKQIEAAGRGVLLYLRGHEGRGVSHSTDDKYEELQLPRDSSDYGIEAQILRDLGKDGLKGYDLTIARKVPLLTLLTGHRLERSRDI
ncbi:Bifunctional riboflavin biosynthesis protein RIBA 1, chloroplastic, partial [Mucuna pruriens]